MKKLCLVSILVFLTASVYAQCWKSVSAGIDHTIAIKPNGTLWAWGFNGAGQLGDGTTKEKNVPTQIGTDSNWITIAAGGNSSFGIKADGTLWAWGDNFWGQLGDGTSGNKRFSPVKIGSDTNWKSISVGRNFTLAIKNDGSLWAWGENLWGQLGNQNSSARSPSRVGTATDWKVISAGGSHTMAIKVDGTLWAWGFNSEGQLGDGTLVNKSTPVKIGNESNWQSIATGDSFSIAVKTNGTLWAWGSNDLGQLGNGTFTDGSIPTQVGTGNNWKSISAGDYSCFATKTDGTLWTWGWIISSVLINTNNIYTTPTQIGLDSDWQSSISGQKHSFAFKADGTLWAWGDYDWGKLGLDSNLDTSKPQRLDATSPVGEAIQLFCGAATVANLNATGVNIKWYTVATGGTALPSTTLLVNGTDYYASQTKSSCESSDRLKVSVSLNTLPTPPPVGASIQTFCGVSTLASLIANGTNVKWYATATGGISLPISTVLENGSRYFASQIINACESSSRLEVQVIVNFTLPPTGTTNQIFCNSATISNLVVTGTNVQWYTTLSGGVALQPNYALTHGTTYYASQTVNSCESPRRSVNVIINSTPVPTGQAAQAFCNSGTIINLVAVGTDIKWYSSEFGGSPLAGMTPLLDGVSYYGTQVLNSCESPVRLKVTASINTMATPPPTGSAVQTVCGGSTISSLVVTGSGIKWYSTASGGTELPLSRGLGEFSRYYASQTINACESSSRLEVSVLVNFTRPSPPTSVQTDSWIAITTGEGHNVGIKNDGTLWAWGDNKYGQLGDGTNVKQTSPTLISTMQDWKAVFAGQAHTLAIKNDGTLWAWGLNDFGQLGDGTTINKNLPIQIGSDTDWVKVTPGFSHTIALKSNGTLWAWGSNEFGQLGDGTNTDRKEPTLINQGFLWKEIASGWNHTIAIKDDGTLWTWGNNRNGKLGDGTTMHRNLPTRIDFREDWTAIAGGSYHTLAIRTGPEFYGRSSETVMACGYNYFGQLGGGSIIKYKLELVGVGGGPKFVAAGDHSSFAIDKDDRLLSWGWEDKGRIGSRYGDNNDPSLVLTFSTTKVKSFSTWGDHSLCILSDGTLWRFGGGNEDGRKVESPSIQVFCGNSTISKLSTNGVNVNWYDVPAGGSPLLPTDLLRDRKNYYATQTVNSCESYSRLPVTVIVNNDNTLPPKGDARQYSCKAGSIADLKAAGSNIKWYDSPAKGAILPVSTPLVDGNHYYASQTVYGCESTSLLEVQVSLNMTPTAAPQGSTFQNFCNGSTISDLIATGNEVKWYSSASGVGHLLPSQKLENGNHYFASQTVNSCESPSRLEVVVSIGPASSIISSIPNWRSVSTTLYHTLAIKQDGSLWAWGGNPYGQLGNNKLVDVNTPIQIGFDTNWKYISAGAFHSIAIKTDGTMWAWGSNYSGTLGNGAIDDQKTPIQIGTEANWQSVSSSGINNLAIKTDGTLWAWGNNAKGNLGDGTSITRYVPVQVGVSNDWISVVAGSSSYGIREDGSLWAWGDNQFGQLGDGTLVNRNIPTRIGNEMNWKFLTKSGVALKSDNTLWRIGTPTGPTQIGQDNDWKTVSSLSHTLAIKSDGSLWAWGDNSYGQLGDGTVTDKDMPVRIGTETDWDQVFVGANHSIALKKDGSQWGWGSNEFGQLGDGTGVTKRKPSLSNFLPPQIFCDGATVSDLAVTAPGTNWYASATGDTPLLPSHRLVDGCIYFAAQPDGACETFPRIRVPAIVNKTFLPTGKEIQAFCTTAFVSDLAANGTNLRWYSSPTEQTPLIPSTPLINGARYYATQMVSNCESAIRLEVLVSITNAPPPTGNSIQNFCLEAKVLNLIATGTNLNWYPSATGGTPFSVNTQLASGMRYYASQTINGCESQSRLEVLVNVNNTPPPTGVSTQTICSPGTISNLTATGTAVKWYNFATGGTELTATSPLGNGARYYASQTLNACESRTRLEVLVNINNTPPPTGASTQTLCSPTTISNLSATGSAIKWYGSATGGTALSASTQLVNGTRYYASQTVNGCESQTRLLVLVTLNSTSAPSGSTIQNFCTSATVSNLVASGINVNWYSSLTSTTPLLPTAALTNGARYYASQTLNACESSSRLEVLVRINLTSAPAGASNQTFCQGAQVANLMVTGSLVKWYSSATGGSPLVGSTLLVDNASYYASQTLNGCESGLRLKVTATVNPVPLAPTGNSLQSFERGKTVADLVAQGSNLKWYLSETDVINRNNQLLLSVPITEGASYFGTQTVSNCESTEWLKVIATIITGFDLNDPLLQFYPNPVIDELNISLNEEIKEIVVLNTIGQIVATKVVNNKEGMINLSDVANGIYLIRVNSSNNSQQFKIIKVNK